MNGSGLTDEFSHPNYVELIGYAKDRFSFRGFSIEPLQPGEIVWRHDVDFSMHKALQLAQIDNSEDVRSTFFFRTRSETYNLYSRPNLETLRSIAGLGHYIGIHFDALERDLDSTVSLDAALHEESIFFRRVTGIDPIAFSFHNTNSKSLRFTGSEYGGLINAYSSNFFEESSYCSDSGGSWRFRGLGAMLRDRSVSQLQVLTHPEWWGSDSADPPFVKIHKVSLEQVPSSLNCYLADLRSFGLPLGLGVSENLIDRLSHIFGRPTGSVSISFFSGDFELALAELWFLWKRYLITCDFVLDLSFVEVASAECCVAEVKAEEVFEYLSEKSIDLSTPTRLFGSSFAQREACVVIDYLLSNLETAN